MKTLTTTKVSCNYFIEFVSERSYH